MKITPCREKGCKRGESEERTHPEFLYYLFLRGFRDPLGLLLNVWLPIYNTSILSAINRDKCDCHNSGNLKWKETEAMDF